MDEHKYFLDGEKISEDEFYAVLNGYDIVSIMIDGLVGYIPVDSSHLVDGITNNQNAFESTYDYNLHISNDSKILSLDIEYNGR